MRAEGAAATLSARARCADIEETDLPLTIRVLAPAILSLAAACTAGPREEPAPVSRNAPAQSPSTPAPQSAKPPVVQSAPPPVAPRTPPPPAATGGVTSPAAHLGRPVAVDFQLADWKEISSYYERLDRESPRVVTQKIGTTTEGRDFLLTAISSEKNIARLETIQHEAAQLADPRGAQDAELERIVATGVPIVMISNAMHSTEAAAPQFAMELAWKLATSDEEPWKSAREKVVVVILPCTNPDGLDHVVEWYRKTVGTPQEGTGLTKLYQLYAGHDNNRDWFMLALAETRIVTEQLYRVWHPQIYWDVHQQGSTAERIFVPPFRDPLDPNLDPGIIMGINLLGTRAMHDMTREGLSGVASGVSFDMWWDGGNRNVPVRHNIVGLLTEAASANLASPIWVPIDKLRAPAGLDRYAASNRFPKPWPGGWWRLRDIVDYELAFARSLLRSVSSEPATWLQGTLDASRRSIRMGADSGASTDTIAPIAWIIPSDTRDPGAARRLADVLIATGVELDVATAEITADGRKYPAGSIVIQRAQPYGGHVLDLFEIQRYPDGDPPYDIAGWTLPLLLGVDRVDVVAPLSGPTKRVASAADAVAGFRTAARSSANSDEWSTLFAQLRESRRVHFSFEGADSGQFTEANADRSVALPRIGLYTPHSGSMDEGWMRWVFDTFGLPYVSVKNEMLRAGRIASFLDVLVLPDVSASSLDQGRAEGSVFEPFAGGLDPEGAVAVADFVRGGGNLIAIGGAAQWAIDLFELPLADAARGKDAGQFSCPGSVLQAHVEPWWLTAGLGDRLSVFFSGSSAWRDMTPDERKEKGRDKPAGELRTLLRYAPSRLLLSGWIRAPEVIEGKSAWIRAEVGRGRVHLFGFSPQYRGWTQNTFQLVFRAAVLDGASDK